MSEVIPYLRSVGHHSLFSSLDKRHMGGRDLRPELCIPDLQLDIPSCHGAKKDYVQNERVELFTSSESGLKVLLHDFMNQR